MKNLKYFESLDSGVDYLKDYGITPDDIIYFFTDLIDNGWEVKTRFYKKLYKYEIDEPIKDGDIKLSMQSFEIGKTFCTKLWNIARFLQMNSIFDIKIETNKITDKLLEEFIINTNKHVQIADFNKLNMKKIKLNKTLKSHKVDLDIIRFVSDYLHINIFLFDETINANKIIYCSGDFIPYKKCIVLYHDEDTYYPVITSNYKVFKFEQSVVKFMLSDISRIATHDNSSFNLVTEVLDSYINKDIAQLIEDNMKIPINKPEETASVVNGFDDEYSPTEKEVEFDSESSDLEQECEATNNKLEEYMTYSLKDLQKLAKDNNIDIKNKTGKFKTKKELAEDLL